MPNSIADVFQQFCHESGFRFHPTGQSIFLGLYSGQHGKWSVFCHVKETLLTVVSVLPVTVPRDKQREVMAYLNLANWQMVIGNFEMDPSDGEVRFRTSIDCADGTLTPDMIASLLFRNLIACDHYLPGLFLILFARSTATQASASIDATADDEASDSGNLNALLQDIDVDHLLRPDSD